jgi:hypothetical protein
MYLELADNNKITQLFIPATEASRNFIISPTFFDRLNDYEYSNAISEILEFNPKVNLNQLIAERDSRRSIMGLPKTHFQPELSSKFGNWLKSTGSKIEHFFKADTQNQPVTATLPDGQQVTVLTPIKKDSPFMGILKGLAGAFGLYQEQTPQQPVQQSSFEKYLPLLAIAGGGFIIYKLITKK